MVNLEPCDGYEVVEEGLRVKQDGDTVCHKSAGAQEFFRAVLKQQEV